MWRDYVSAFCKSKSTGSGAVRAVALLSALLLSLLLSVFYNLWKYETERIILAEGGWHSRLSGQFDTGDLTAAGSFAHVITAGRNAQGGIDLVFDSPRQTLALTPLIAARLGAAPQDIAYHQALLALYGVRDPQDPAPRLLFPLFVLITALAAFSLIVIIHNAFAVTMDAQVHQLGILASIGATPRQLRACLVQQAARLCAGPLLAGNLLGILAGLGLTQMTNHLDLPDRHTAVFGYPPLLLGLSLLVTALTVWFSAWMPARRLSRLTPLAAIRSGAEPALKRRRTSPLLARAFGVPGELAGNALKAQRRALRTVTWSFLLAFLAFSMMECVFTLSLISTQETYFARYRDAWDVMLTVKNTSVTDFAQADALRALPKVKSAVIYQKAAASRLLTAAELSDALNSLGGLAAAPAGMARPAENGWLVNAPILILDDESFLAYCAQIGAPARLDGVVVRNAIADLTDPDFRHRQQLPYLNGKSPAAVFQSENGTAELPVLSYTDIVPVLREEYGRADLCELVHFMPASLWAQLGGRPGAAAADSTVRLLYAGDPTLPELDALQAQAEALLGQSHTVEGENRLREEETNDRQIRGMMAFMGGFCVLLALIGIGSIFSYALGFVRQRRRELARYLSVGMTPQDLKTMFCLEAAVLAGRPVLLSLPVVAAAVAMLLNASYMEPSTFLAQAPYLPILLFMLLIAGSVALAYALGWRSVRSLDLAEVLRDDAML